MKLFSKITAAFLILSMLVSPAFFGPAATNAAGQNLIANPSAETATGSTPANWLQGGWGTNTAAFTYANTGQEGTRSMSVNVSSYTNGDAKWYFTPVSVTPGTQYTFNNWYQSTVPTEIDAQITDTAGNITYAWLSSPAASSVWKQNSLTWTAPANAKSVTFFHVIAATGTLVTDNFSLTAATATPVPTPTPTVTPTPTPAPTPTPTPDNDVPNPSVEIASGTAPQSWTAGSWGTNTAAFSYLGTGHTGSRSVKVTVSGYTSGSADWSYTPQTVKAGQRYMYSDWYQSNVTTEIDAAVTMTDGTIQYMYLATAPASTVWAQAKAEFTTPPGAVRVTIFHLIATNGYLTTDDFSFGAYAPKPLTRGLVSITFDDGWINQYTNAFPLLKKYGQTATFYVLSGELTNQPTYMSVAQMKDLYAKGNEIASHSITHSNLTTATAAKLTKEMSQSKSVLQTKVGVPVTNFAYPYGAYNAKTITEGNKYYQSQRSTDTGYNALDTLNLTALKVQNIYDTTTPAQVQAWVNQAAKDRTWLILVYHEVATTPLDPADARYTTKPADLDAELAILKNSGLGILTVKQAISEITPQLNK